MEKPTLSTMVVLYTTNLKFDTTKLVECIPLSETLIRAEKRGVMKKGVVLKKNQARLQLDLEIILSQLLC
jgi:hypothetical protein